MLCFLYFLVWLHVFVPWALTFKIDIQSTVTVGQNASFSWTWNQTDSSSIGIALKTGADKDGCPEIKGEFDIFEAFKKDDLVTPFLKLKETQLELDNTKRGKDDFAVRQAGPCRLCAYSYEDFKGKYPTKFNLIASSQELTAVLPSQSLPAGAIAGIAIGGVAFLILLVAGVFLYRRIRYRRRLAQYHRERLILQQTPPPLIRIASPVISEKRATITTTNSSTPLIHSPKRPYSHRRSIPFGYDDNMTKTYQFPPSTDGTSVSSVSMSTPLPVTLPIDPERALHPARRDGL